MAWSTSLPPSQLSPRMLGKVRRAANRGEGACQVACTRIDPLISALFPLQGGCHWLWRAHPRRRSPARTTRMAPVLCPTYPQRLETIASSCALTTSTSQGAPSQPRSQVRQTFRHGQPSTYMLKTVHPGRLDRDCWAGGEHLEINVRMLCSTAGKEHPTIPCFKRCDHLCQLEASLVYIASSGTAKPT